MDLPWLTGKRGVFVVELVGGGKRCRAVLQRGGLRHTETPGVAGHAVNVMYEDNSPVPDARSGVAWGLRRKAHVPFKL